MGGGTALLWEWAKYEGKTRHKIVNHCQSREEYDAILVIFLAYRTA